MQYFLKHRWIMPVLVFAAAFVYVGWFWPTLTFPDADSFYHIKMTELLAHGIPRVFPWLPFTVLADAYIDHHLLYHAFLLPFVLGFGSFVGAKIATMMLAAGVAAIFYEVARRLQFRAPLFFTILLFTAPGFFLRMTLTKAPAFSLIFVLLGVLFLMKRRSVALAILAFVYVWAYNVWPLLTVMAVLWMFSRSFLEAFLHDSSSRPNTFWKKLTSSEHARPLFGVVAGTLAGMVINPYFPKNFLFYWYHIVQIGIVNYGAKIQVGAEWYPMNFLQLLGDNALVIAMFVLAVAGVMKEAQRQARAGGQPNKEALLRAFALTIFAAVFFVFTARSRRNIEYFVPFATLATASLVTLAWPSIHHAARRARAWVGTSARMLLFIPIVLCIAFLSVLPVRSLLAHRSVVMHGETPQTLSGAISYLALHAPAGTVIFHDEWDMFPLMLYHNDRMRYISGLDPTFLYEADPVKYELWRAASYGEYAGDVAQAIHDTFDAQYVLLTHEPGMFARQLEFSDHAQLVYEDDESRVFKIVYEN